MSTSSKILGGLFILVAIGAALVFMVAPGIIDSKEKELVEKLKKKGVSLRYASFEKSISGALTFRDLEFQSKKQGMAFDCHFKNIEIKVGLLESLSGSPKIENVLVDDGLCEIKTTKKKKKEKEKKKDEKKTKSPLADLKIPSLKVTNTLFRFKQHSLRIHHFTSPSEGAVDGEILLRALGEKYAMKVSGEIGADALKVNLSPLKEKKFDVNILGNQFQLASLVAEISKKSLSAKAYAKDLQIDRKGFSVLTKLAGAELKGSTKPKFFIEGTKVQIEKEILQNFVAPKKSAGDSFDSPAPLLSPFAIADKLDLSFSDFALSMRFGEREIGLVEKAQGFWKRGELQVDGEIAKGKVRAQALLNLKEKHLYRMRADIEKVQLGVLPGMPAGRSELPNRGTSGKIDGLLSGSFRLESPWQATLDAPIEYAMSLRWEDGVLDLEGVSADPLDGIDFSSSMTGKVNLSTFEIQNDGHLLSQKTPFRFSSKMSGWPKDLQVSASLTSEEQDCKNFFSALPPAVWGPLKNAKTSGKGKLDFQILYEHARPQETSISIKGYEKCVVDNLNSTQKIDAKIAGIKNPDFSDVDWLNKAFIKKVKEVDAGKEVYVGPGTKSYVSLGGLPEHVGGAAYLSEQMNFYTGQAINFALIQRALQRNLDEGRFVYGGSTITQQLVKNLFLTRDKTLARKLQEVLIAWRMENLLGKDKILELYLNCIEFGPNLYGIGRAAHHYFQKSATQLTAKESVFLAMLKPAPWRGVWYVNKGATPTNPYFLERTDILLDRLVEKEMITEEVRASEQRVGLTWTDGKYSRVLLPEIVEESLNSILQETPKIPPPTP